MDRLVDHLFVFEGDGIVNDFPGNYSQYRIKQLESTLEPEYITEKDIKKEKPQEQKVVKTENTNKLSFNEKREFELIEKEMPLLEKEKSQLEIDLSNEKLHYDEMQKISNRIIEVIYLIEQKELRWLELSEKSM